MLRKIFGLFAVLFSVACQVSPSHPSLIDSTLPPLMPVRNFVANGSYNDNYRLSPDGAFMVYQGVANLRAAIFIKDLSGKTKTRVLRFKRNAPEPFWAADSKHVLFHVDADGRENYHVFAVNVDDPTLTRRDLTPFEATKSFVARVPRKDSSTIYVMHNSRNKEIFDLYELDLPSGQLRLIFENNGGVEKLLLDDLGNVKARVFRDEEQRQLQISTPTGQWNSVLEFDQFDSVFPIDFDASGDALYLSTNHDSDKHQLVKLDLNSGEQKVLFADEDYDLGWATLSSKDSRLLFVSVQGDYPQVEFFDEAFKNALAPFIEYGKHGMNLMSMTRAEDAITLARYNSKGASFYYYDLKTGESRLLGNGAMQKYSDRLTNKQPIKVEARDGLPLEGYLSLPNGAPEKNNLPTVLLVHGGPWARDTWRYDTATQFLNNRGYAVLSINYRGSIGYGKQFMMASTREFAGKMHDDLIDTIDWAIDEGISDPDRIAIMGRSYGGYATLVGMTKTPDRFACGVNIVGVADLASLLENVPPYWRNSMHLWHRVVGDPANPADRADMDKRSPLNFAKNVKNPILIIHGENDPRVNIDQSERMVRELKKYGKQVKYIPIKGEGHGFNHWKNQLKIYRETEDFLANCLGGRSAGFDFYSLGSWAF